MRARPHAHAHAHARGSGRVTADVDAALRLHCDVKVQFAALGLIEKGTKRRPGSDTSTYWRLTDRGHQQLLRLRAIRKPPLVETQRDYAEGHTAAE